MSPERIASTVLKKHPELKTLPPDLRRLVKRAITEAARFASWEVISPESKKRSFQLRIQDQGKPSAILQAYRKRAELSQRELAKQCDIPQPNIAAMETGKKPIGLIAAKKLARVFGINYRKLV